jgi:hypothetical protein
MEFLAQYFVPTNDAVRHYGWLAAGGDWPIIFVRYRRLKFLS